LNPWRTSLTEQKFQQHHDYDPELAQMNDEETMIEIACQQVLKNDGSVFSIQWALLPSRHTATLTPRFLLERYLAYLRRFTFSLVRPLETADSLEFRFLSTKSSLLIFAPPEFSTQGDLRVSTLRICEGHFVQAACCNRGKFSFMVESVNDGVKIAVQLSDYFPRLLGSRTPSLPRKWLYRLTQAFIHRIVTVRFLARLYQDLEGEKVRFRTVKVYVQSGEDI
jgi:hypothetical protein